MVELAERALCRTRGRSTGRQAERARRFEQQLAARGLRAVRADEAVGDFASLPYDRLLADELREPMPGWIAPDGAD